MSLIGVKLRRVVRSRVKMSLSPSAFSKTVRFMKVNGSKIKGPAKASKSGRMGLDTMACGSLEQRAGTVV